MSRSRVHSSGFSKNLTIVGTGRSFPLRHLIAIYAALALADQPLNREKIVLVSNKVRTEPTIKTVDQHGITTLGQNEVGDAQDAMQNADLLLISGGLPIGAVLDWQTFSGCVLMSIDQTEGEVPSSILGTIKPHYLIVDLAQAERLTGQDFIGMGGDRARQAAKALFDWGPAVVLITKRDGVFIAQNNVASHSYVTHFVRGESSLSDDEEPTVAAEAFSRFVGAFGAQLYLDHAQSRHTPDAELEWVEIALRQVARNPMPKGWFGGGDLAGDDPPPGVSAYF